eukprot:scaffold439319_cov34-Prasinocladus_malaysianus.AAC.1
MRKLTDVAMLLRPPTAGWKHPCCGNLSALTPNQCNLMAETPHRESLRSALIKETAPDIQRYALKSVVNLLYIFRHCVDVRMLSSLTLIVCLVATLAGASGG